MVKKDYYCSEAGEKNAAKAFYSNKQISLKYAVEMCREIKGKPVKKAEAYLERVMQQQDFLPLKKYNKKIAHRKGSSKSGVKSGRFPVRACQAFLDLLESVKANADFKGLDAENLIVKNAFASQGFRRLSHQPKGRIGGKRRQRKSTNLEIVVIEGKF